MTRTNLFEIADERGIRYRWLASQLGYTPEYLSRIKSGVMPVTAEFQRRVCDLFPDIPPEALFVADDGLMTNQMVSEQGEKEAVPA